MLTEHEERERSNSACGVTTIPEAEGGLEEAAAESGTAAPPTMTAASRQKNRIILKERHRSGSMDLSLIHI